MAGAPAVLAMTMLVTTAVVLAGAVYRTVESVVDATPRKRGFAVLAIIVFHNY